MAAGKMSLARRLRDSQRSAAELRLVRVLEASLERMRLPTKSLIIK